VGCTGANGGILTAAPEEPQIAVGGFKPARCRFPRSRHVGGSGRPLYAVGTALPCRIGPTDPSPLARDDVELPQIVERPDIVGRIPAVASEEPQIPVRVDPADRVFPRAGNVGRGGGAFRTVDADLILGVRAAYPGPLAAGDVVFPQVVEIPEGDHRLDRAVAIAPEEPQIAAGVGPADRAVSRSGNVARSGRAFGAVGPELVDRAGPAHPGPLAVDAA